MQPFDPLVMAAALMDDNRRQWAQLDQLRELHGGRRRGMRLGLAERLRVAFTGRLDVPDTGVAVQRRA